MSDFSKSFLLEDPRRFSPSGRFVALGAFGKHPGWDDHVEDLGLETESLNLAKTLLYVNGIGGQIDSGAWEKLEPEQQMPAFKHLFVWQRSGQMLVGRLWSSSDGKGRKRYPMVVCLHFGGVSLEWALKQALPVLAQLEEGCLLTTSADEVRSLLSRKRAALRELVQSSDTRREYAPMGPSTLQRILRPSAGSDREGFLRVLYQIESQMGTVISRPGSSGVRAQQIRVPAAAAEPEQAILFWTRFFLTQVDPTIPMLLTLPLEAGWVDVTVGEPESHEFFCLRASAKAVPLVSEVPYTLDEAFRAKARAFLDGFERGETKPLERPALAAASSDTVRIVKSGWRKWFGLGVVLVLGAAAVFLVLPRGGKPTADRPTAQGQSEASKPSPQAPSPTAASASVPAPSQKLADAPGPAASPAGTGAPSALDLARQAEEKKQQNALAAAARLKAETEAAVLERRRQEAARLQKATAAAAQKQVEDQQRAAADAAAAAAKPKPDQPAVANAVETSPSAVKVATPTASGSAFSMGAPAGTHFTNSVGMVLVRVPSGLWVGKYEVTQSEYQAVMGTNPSKSKNDRQPVEQVTWNDAMEFTRKLTELEKSNLPSGYRYSLPNAGQWKDFLGGQKFEDLPGGGVTWKGRPSAVGESSPSNKFGLFDVLGNVWEWCLDGGDGEEKILKGGAFNHATYERRLAPDQTMISCGFRCVIAAP